MSSNQDSVQTLREELLLRILSQPSAPFRERHVIDVVTATLEQAGVPYFSDRTGNLVIGAGSRKEYERMLRGDARKGGKRDEPLRVYIAHMDHPGFIGTRWRSPRELEARWHGGSPVQHLTGAPVWLAGRDHSEFSPGLISEFKLASHGRAMESLVIRVTDGDTISREKKAESLFGGFAFRAPVWREGGLLYTKAADDLVGTFAVLSLALDLHQPSGRKPGRKAAAPPFIGLLTRAEEVGFIGAIGHFEEGLLQRARRPVLCVSLETSRTLPGAEIGKGPVVRLGDRFTVFDPASLRIFSRIAQGVLPDRHQKRVMDGGACEATAATVYGLKTVGISVPLGNYHNQSFQGGPDSRGPDGPAPEFVHLEDLRGMLTLCHGLLEPGQPWTAPWADRLRDFRKDFRGYRALLRSGP